MPALLQRLYDLGINTWDVITRFLYLIFGFIGWLFTVPALIGLILLTIGVSAGMWGFAHYGGTGASYIEFGLRCRVNAFFDAVVDPIIDGIIRRFYNPLICWWDGFVWTPYGTGREVIFPWLRDCGFLQTVVLFGQFLNQVFRDFLVGYLATGAFLNQPLDTNLICDAWQIFWQSWQNLLCCGCYDLCPFFTDLPVIPMFFSSTQIRDRAWWNWMSNCFNGWMYVFQETLRFIRQFVYPIAPENFLRPQLRPAFDFWCQASDDFWTSWENAFQRIWDSFLPWEFVWEDVFCIFAKMSCIMLRSLNVLLNILFNGDRVLSYFRNIDIEFWTVDIKFQVKEVLNLMAEPVIFDEINIPLPPGSNVPAMVITNYYWNNTQEGVIDNGGVPNPVFNQTRATECLCNTIKRFMCDPLNNGTTCEQQYNGTLLESFDFCCITDNLGNAMVNMNSWLFETTLHLRSANDFVVFINEQPFSLAIKENLVILVSCIGQIFDSIPVYGVCIDTVITELARFFLCIMELLYRIFIALVSLPYYATFLPGLCNLLTCPGDQALNEALGFLDRLVADTPDSLINCLCFLLNTGFPVPPAGCSNCTVGGFIPPVMNGGGGMAKKAMPPRIDIYNLTMQKVFGVQEGHYRYRLNPLITYDKEGRGTIDGYWSAADWWSKISLNKAAAAFAEPAREMDFRLENTIENWKLQSCAAPPVRHGRTHNLNPHFNYHDSKSPQTCGSKAYNQVSKWNAPSDPNELKTEDMPINNVYSRLQTQAPIEPVVCSLATPCFDLCCFPKALIVWFAQLLSFAARALNGALQTINGINNGYWDGTACNMMMPCFASDLTAFIVNTIAPLKCLCNFIMLVIPPMDYPDPCCAFTVAGELISCTLQVLINVINSAAGDPNFTYIKDPNGLLADFDILLELVLNLYDCACSFIRIIVGVVIDENNLVKNFDPCCTYRKLLVMFLELARMIMQIVVFYGTIEEPESQCYFYVRSVTRPTCTVSLNDLPVMVQFDRVRAALLAPPKPIVELQCSAQVPIFQYRQQTGEPLAQDEGISSCICLAIDSLLAQVFKPDPDSTDPPGCPINACCVIYRLASAIDNVLAFASRLIASLWQNWELKAADFESGTEFINVPVEFVDFVFCNEYAGETNPNLGGPLSATAVNPDGNATTTSKCGRLEPALSSIEALLSQCTCNNAGTGIGNVADEVLRWLFWFVSGVDSNPFPIMIDWPKCLCSGGPDGQGFLRPYGRLYITLARQVIILIRNLANPSYWEPEGGSLSNPGFAATLTNNIVDIRKTWINRFLAPFADVACQFITNLTCILSIIIGNTCVTQRYNVAASFIRYYFEAIIRLIAILEAFVKLFAQELAGQCVGDPSETDGQGNGVCSQGGGLAGLGGLLSADQIGAILVSLLTFIFDAAIGISRFSCSKICPETTIGINTTNALTNPNTCSCLNWSPYVGIGAPEIGLCNFDTCQTSFGKSCPPGETNCTLDSLFPGDPALPGWYRCGLAGTGGIFTSLSDPAFQRCLQCKDGCINMTEPIFYQPAGPGSWLENPLTIPYPWVPEANASAPFGVICVISNNPPQEVIDLAIQAFQFPCSLNVLDLQAFLDCAAAVNGTVQPPCVRDTIIDPNTDEPLVGCVQNGYCKNDQLVSCGGFNLEILDGVIIAALKYVACLLDILYDGLGSLVYVLIYVLSVVWQWSGGIIRFVVAFLVMVLNFLQRPWILNIFLIIPDFFNLLGTFFAIFTQPVVWGARTVLRTMGVPLRHTRSVYSQQQSSQQSLEEGMIALFGTSINGCIEDPINCVCTGLTHDSNNTCPLTSESTTMELLSFVDSAFEDGTECSDLIRMTYMGSYPEWDQLSLTHRYEFVRCLARRSKGSRWNMMTKGFWPKDFFYAEDGYYKVWLRIRDVTSSFVARETRREQERREETRRSFEEHLSTDMDSFYRSVRVRAALQSRIMEQELNISPESPAFKFIVFMDSMHFKWRSGYYGHLFSKAAHNLKFGNWPLGTLQENIDEIREAIEELRRTTHMMGVHTNLVTQHFNSAWDTVGRFAQDVVSGKVQWQRLFHFKSIKGVEIDNARPNYLRSEPYVRMWNQNMGLKKETIINDPSQRGFRLSEGTTALSGLRTAWNSLKSVELWPKMIWSPTVLHNWELFKALLFRIHHGLWPHLTGAEHHERFVLQSNCRLVGDTIELVAGIADYCLDDFVPNIPNDTVARNQIWPDSRNGYEHPNFVRQQRVATDSRSWTRRRHRQADKWKQTSLWNIFTRHDAKPATHVDSRIYKRATQSQGTYGGFDLLNWFVCVIADIFGIDLGQDVSNFFDDLVAWFTNPNTDPALYPDVGFLYWATFEVRCEFPYNMDCSIGIGLDEALQRVTWVFFLIIVITLFLFPGLLGLIGGVALLFIYLLVLMAVAWHYSIGCFVMWPTWPVRTGLSLPLLPLPVSLFGLPMCLWDDIVEVTDKYITDCYSEFINASLVNGPVCPECDQFIDIINCADIGMQDPIAVMLYWGNRWFGPLFGDIVVGFACTTVGRWINGLEAYFEGILENIQDASDTQQVRLEWCAYWMLPSLLLPITALIVAGTFLIFFIPALLNLIMAFLRLIQSLPIFDAITGQETPTGYFQVDGEDATPQIPEAYENADFVGEEVYDAMASHGKWGRTIGMTLDKWFSPKRKME